VTTNRATVLAIVTTAGLALLGPVAVGTVAAGMAAAATPAATAARVPLAAAPAVPHGAVVGATLPSDQPLSADVTLAVPDPTALAAFVAAVSTPASAEYRQYLAPGQFASRFGPSPSAIAGVRNWLTGEGLTVGPAAGDGLLLPVHGPAAAMAQAFGTSLASVRLPSGQTAYTDTVAPTVPSGLAGVVHGVVGLSDVARWHSDLETGSAVPPQACSAAGGPAFAGGPLTFTQLASAYDLSGLYPQGRTGAGVTVAIYELEPHATADVQTFERCYGLSTAVTNVTVDGGPGTGYGSGEAALDIEDVAALAPGANILVYQGPNSTRSGAGSGPLDTMNQIAADDRARVVTTSWGVCEATLTSTAAALENRIFQAMATQGQTMLAASGDSGSEGCWYQGTSANRNTSTTLDVGDPASQPDVTGVGGTALPTGGTAGQTVWNDCQAAPSTTRRCARDPDAGASGGGVSQLWTMPSWQSAAGATRLAGASTACSGYCREVPDVSADAAPDTGYVVYYRGGWEVLGGTSGAAPLWAAVMAVTDQGCAGAIGFANPALYQLGSTRSGAFSDVATTGNNDLTRNHYVGIAVHAYPTVAGYDMATGWGSPVAATLLADLQPAGGCPAVTAVSSTHGPVTGGGTVTIFGSDLAGASTVDFGSLGATIVSASTSQVTVALPAAPYAEAVDVTVTTPNGTSAATGTARYTFGTPRNGVGYWLSASDGGIFAFGDAQFYGSMGGQPLNQPIVSVAATPDDGGYWEVASDGGIFAFGDAQFYGSMGGQPLNQPIVGIATTPDGRGYWEVASDGGIFAFGDAAFHGSMGGQPLNKPIVGIATTPDGLGYWEVASDGGIFAFGNAQFYGSMGGQPLNKPVVAIAPTTDGTGYWEVASDGGIFAFGNAQFYGSMGGQPLNRPIVAMTGTPDGAGYWEVASDGGIFAFGDAAFYGSTGNLNLVAPIVGMADT
jgi:subtilase family serine protease